MNPSSQVPSNGCTPGSREATGFSSIIRTLPLAAQPAKIGLAFAAIVATFALGWLLDLAWSPAAGIDESAVVAWVASREDGTAYNEPKGELGPFEVFRRYERRAILGFLGSAIPGRPIPVADPGEEIIGSRFYAGPVRNLIAMIHGVLWMARAHPFYFILFAAGALLIWALLGGAICRIAALHFARDERPTVRQGLEYAQKRWLGGFFVAPCIPVALTAIVVICLILGGLVLSIPVIGDLVGGLLFFLAILGGVFAAALLVGFLVGGSLFWPAVAVEGADGFDAFSRALAYSLTRPLKTLVYAAMLVLYASVCWVLLRVFVYFALSITRTGVGFGTGPFGWFNRGSAQAPQSKIDVLWPMHGPNVLWASPNWEALRGWEYISAGWIAFWVLLVVGLVWSFLFSFYFSGSTIAYFLLRRNVDLTDLDEIFVEEELPGFDRPALPDSDRDSGANIPIPVSGSGTSTASASGPASV